MQNYRSWVIDLVHNTIIIMQRRNFDYFVRIPPFDLIHLNPSLYMFTVGLTEVACVAIIILSFFLPFLGCPSVLATWVLLVMMFGAIYSHFMIGDAVSEMGWAFFGLAIVLIRLYTMDALWQTEIKVKV